MKSFAQVGRIGLNYNKVCGHTGNVMDIKWDPFDDHVIASAAEDGKVGHTPSSLNMWINVFSFSY